ncbi:MAG: GMP reductase [Albidovulum sp.]|nr:GMP reductase [Albidovulum sp.]
MRERTSGANAMISEDVKLDYDDVLIVPDKSPVASRKQVMLEKRISFSERASAEYVGVPIMAANMDGVGTTDMADALRRHGIFTCLTKFHSARELADFFNGAPERGEFTAVTIGISDEDLQKFVEAENLAKGRINYACLDVANGYTDRFVDRVRKFRDMFPGIVLIAGNVVTHEQTSRLIEAGADIVKVGIGGGSVCETRVKTGVGYPQFSAIQECVHSAHRVGKAIVADGGCTVPGDVAKALAGGADFVMLGGMLAGHLEGGGTVISKYFRTDEVDEAGNPIVEKRNFVEFYGMSSKTANEKHFGGLQNYRSSEGRTVMIPFRPSLDDTVVDLLGGLRSTCSYVGAEKIGQLPEKASFVRCNSTHNKVFQDLD